MSPGKERGPESTRSDRDHRRALSGGSGAGRLERDRDHRSALSGGSGAGSLERDRDHRGALSGGSGAGSVELPAPTASPMALALGVTLIFAGLVTHGSVSAVGVVLALVSAVGWWRQVLPVEQVEHVPLAPPAERPKAIAPTVAGVERLALGEGRHRMRLPVEVQPLSAGLVGGIAGGIAMAAVALFYGLVFQGSIWYPINLLSAVAMPGMAQASPVELRAFSGAALVIGIVAHGVISMLAGLLYAVILPMLPSRHTLWGGLVAPLLWTGFLWAVLGVINPTLNALVNWGWFIGSQVAFGLVTGFVVAQAQPVKTMQTLPLAARAGVQAGGMRREGDRRR